MNITELHQKLHEAYSNQNLNNLKSLDLANNKVKDISPLLNLNRLEYADLSGSKVSLAQIRILEESGITVVAKV